MPEGDAVRRSAAALDEALSGRILTSTEFRVPRFATVDLSGQRVLETVAIGKHLLTRTDAGLTVHSHRRMEGRWVTGPSDLKSRPYHQIRAVLRTSDTVAIGLRLAMLEVAKSSREEQWIGHLGPDVLAEDFDPGLALPADRDVVEALLDQRVIAGLGTMWAAEAAFAAGVSPYARVGDVEMSGALADVRSRMRDSVTGRRPAMAVFGRKGLPCRVCGAVIASGRVGRPPHDRITYWCPTCQG